MAAARRDRGSKLVVGFLAPLIAAVLAACSATPHLSYVGGDIKPVYSATNDASVGQSVIFGGIYLCVDSPGQVAITNVAVQQGDYAKLQVRDFAVRPYYDHQVSFGGQQATLAAFGGGFDVGGKHLVSGHCPSPPYDSWQPRANDGIVELGIEVARTSADVEGGPGLDITYTVDGRTEIYSTPFGIMVCASTCPKPRGW